MNKKNIAIIFGGRSAEHEVSLQSARNIINALDRKKFNPILIGVTKQGRLCLQNESNYLLNQEDPKLIALNKSSQEVAVVPDLGKGKSLVNLSNNSSQKIDAVFPVMHGPFGEDGTIQGLLKFFNVPFVGPSVLGSAVAMDKEVAKRLLTQAGIKNSKYMVFKNYETKPSYEKVKKELGPVVFVKPANLGSSVGVSRAKNKKEFDKAVKLAFKHDQKILVEKAVKGREVECAVLGLGKNVKTSKVIAEVISTNKEGFYSYDAKYIDEDGAKIVMPAEVSPRLVQKVRKIAVKAFQTLELEIMARVDCFVKKNGEVYVNEVNTIPGFTNISMYPKLWEASGLSQKELVTRLIELAMERDEK